VNHVSFLWLVFKSLGPMSHCHEGVWSEFHCILYWYRYTLLSQDWYFWQKI